MGNLFKAGGQTADGDGVRELYVGSLAHVGKEVCPAPIDYLALGHLHVPQVVGGTEHIRYSGSPIPMGYGEATQEKKVVLVEFNGTTPSIQELAVPCFQQLVRIVGSLDEIKAKLEELKNEDSRAWLEIEYTGKDIISNFQDIMNEAIADSGMEIRRLKNRRSLDIVVGTISKNETLDDLDPGEVFTRFLDGANVSDEDRTELTATYKEAIKSLNEEDVNAE
ncbi:MAG: exonuclease SbcCD subunit D C-terminal domain-containing protein, partial [Planctomycetes bacterium]|nr:exonuclease SbcCD subunit D C-terminal domain-containing protein [Planctomycetota bacterium]